MNNYVVKQTLIDGKKYQFAVKKSPCGMSVEKTTDGGIRIFAHDRDQEVDIEKYTGNQASLKLHSNGALEAINVDHGGCKYSITAKELAHYIKDDNNMFGVANDLADVMKAVIQEKEGELITKQKEAQAKLQAEKLSLLQQINNEGRSLSTEQLRQVLGMMNVLQQLNQQLGFQVGNNVSSLSNNTPASNQTTLVPLNLQNDKSKKQSDIGISK